MNVFEDRSMDMIIALPLKINSSDNMYWGFNPEDHAHPQGYILKAACSSIKLCLFKSSRETIVTNVRNFFSYAEHVIRNENNLCQTVSVEFNAGDIIFFDILEGANHIVETGCLVIIFQH